MKIVSFFLTRGMLPRGVLTEIKIFQKCDGAFLDFVRPFKKNFVLENGLSLSHALEEGLVMN